MIFTCENILSDSILILQNGIEICVCHSHCRTAVTALILMLNCFSVSHIACRMSHRVYECKIAVVKS